MINKKKATDIENIVFDTLSKSNSFGVFPTPVDKILTFADLKVNSGVDLSQIPKNFLAKSGLWLDRGIAKIRGALDRREKVIYLDLRQSDSKKRFVKLHEAGHELCSWQGRLHDFLDTDETLDHDTKELFEAEANFFASASLFQLDVFNDRMAELPLELASVIQLSKTFGSSIHAALRRYVEKSFKRCALLVLTVDRPTMYGTSRLLIRNYFQSSTFSEHFGTINWGSELDLDNQIFNDFLSKRKFFKSEFTITTEVDSIDCQYHYFYNGYNIFVLMHPKGEVIKSRTKFIVST